MAITSKSGRSEEEDPRQTSRKPHTASLEMLTQIAACTTCTITAIIPAAVDIGHPEMTDGFGDREGRA